MTERVQTPSPYSAIFGLLVIVVIIIGGLVLLNRIEAENPTEAEITLTPTPAARVSFVLDGLSQIDNAEYVVWGESSERVLFLGAFTVTGAGRIEGSGDTAFSDNELVVDNDLSSVTRIFITLEQPGENVQPAGPEVLSAEMEEGIGALTSPFARLGEFAGEYMLATPTDAPNTNETSGIWFVHRNADGSEAAGLTLPPLPQGWEYSGVVRHQDTLLYTGSFSSATGSDSFSLHSGEIPAPEYPGEDFLTNKPLAAGFDFPVNLADGTSEVTVRITTAQPFVSQSATNEFPVSVLQHVVLRAMVIEGADTNTNYPMTPVELELPAGIVVIR